MKKEEISDALNMLHDDIIEETNLVRREKKKKRLHWVKWGVVAACLVLAVYAGMRMFPKKSPGNTIELPLLTISENSTDSMGFEGYMAYDISELTNQNPWKETTEISALPVYQNPLSYDENSMASGADSDKMRELLMEIAGRLGLDPVSLDITDNAPDEETKQKIIEKLQIGGDTVPEGYFEPTSLTAEAEGLKIEVDQSMTATIFFEPAISLPEEYNFTHYASYEELLKAAKYLKKEYQNLIHFEDSKINIYGGDYNINLQQVYHIEFFDAGGSQTEQIVNYNFNRIAFYCNDDGDLFLARIYQPDLSQKVGDYPIITADEASDLLSNGNYITSVPYEMAGLDYAAKVELVYRRGTREQYYMPYYCFYVEIPELEEKNGLKTYGAYYVPAVRSEYISNMPLWDGGFN
ncbi:hypothetical protein LQE92_00445 [Lacrimispora sp. NSJ-141]|uniref:Uncharacterized protein n=1 Tax=Lientehia hominis TaxID=2897778 RepID=A0AAP2RFL3_9FIRM|nr:hypothetical protein [Lientehia hominis]MCD2491092.1 hypothetical protein [Lientehia hominis]